MDTRIIREMGRSDASSYRSRSSAVQKILCGPRDRSLDGVGLRYSGKMLERKIVLYNIFELDLKSDF